MRNLPLDVRTRADGLLKTYGGLAGLSRNPPWVVGIVLKTWFTESDRKDILSFLLQGVKEDLKLPLMKEMGLR